MTTVSVKEFLSKATEDASLQSDLAKALEADNDREAVTELANSKGYDFSSDELWAVIQARQAEVASRQESGELSDEELEAVAGGEIIIALGIGGGLAAIKTVAAATVTVSITKW